ncbi:hypothetical protein ACFY8C_02985 [Streptomyces flavochromogenes]|uniref:Uncharacterized protein n=1 Tax=Streptomyces flavochromogenes TaxID=68199 RepID=A0ABW6XIJ8_9ACTN|nr:hypothetical protein [Streptomyces flavochromogenes]
MTSKTDTRPVFELRLYGFHVVAQRIPGWLLTLVATAGGAAGTWWAR